MVAATTVKIIVGVAVGGLLLAVLILTCVLYVNSQKGTQAPRTRTRKVPPGMTRTVISDDPILDSIEGFMSPEEADAIVALVQGRFDRSVVVDDKTGAKAADPSRTSSSVFLLRSENELIAAIEERAAALAGIPSTHLERLQVVRYSHGQFYKPHYDYLPLVGGDVATHGQRSVTIFAYLNDLPADEPGGGTRFPELSVTVRPKKGAAALWHNMKPDGKTDPRTLHGGEEVTAPGTVKYGLNIWFRTRSQAHG